MELSETKKAVLARWNELGSVTPANPILALAYEQYLSAIGLKCGGLTYDALSALEDTSIRPMVTSPVFDASLLNKDWSQFSVIEPLLPLLNRLQPSFDQFGLLTSFDYISEEAETDPSVIDFQTHHADEIFTLSQNLVDCTKLYIDGALEGLLSEEPISENLREIFLKNPKQYAEVIWEIFVRQGQTPPQV
jgi:hypothetical protein